MSAVLDLVTSARTLDTYERMAAVVMAATADGDGVVRLPYRSIGELVGCSARKAQQAVGELVTTGWIERVDERWSRVNAYRIAGELAAARQAS